MHEGVQFRIRTWLVEIESSDRMAEFEVESKVARERFERRAVISWIGGIQRMRSEC